jgi:hypothetical protein
MKILRAIQRTLTVWNAPKILISILNRIPDCNTMYQLLILNRQLNRQLNYRSMSIKIKSDINSRRRHSNRLINWLLNQRQKNYKSKEKVINKLSLSKLLEFEWKIGIDCHYCKNNHSSTDLPFRPIWLGKSLYLS